MPRGKKIPVNSKLKMHGIYEVNSMHFFENYKNKITFYNPSSFISSTNFIAFLESFFGIKISNLTKTSPR